MANVYNGNYPKQFNEFTQSSIQKIAEQALKGVSIKRSPIVEAFNHGVIDNGAQLEEVFYGLATQHTYDTTKTDFDEVFGTEPDLDLSYYHTRTYERRFKMTINEPEMKKMLTSASNISTVLTAKAASINSSENAAEYYSIQETIENPEQGKLRTLTVGDVTAADPKVSDAASRKLAIELKALIPTLALPNTYNLAGVKNSSDVKDLVLLLSPRASASIKVNMFADMFNMDQAQVNLKTIVLPAEFNDTNTVGYLLSANFLFIREIVDATTTQPIAPTLSINMFRNRQQLVSTSPFEFGVRLVKEDVENPERLLASSPYKAIASKNDFDLVLNVDGLKPGTEYAADVAIQADRASTVVPLSVTPELVRTNGDKEGTLTLHISGFDSDKILSRTTYNVGVTLNKVDGDAKTPVAVFDSHVSKSHYYGEHV